MTGDHPLDKSIAQVNQRLKAARLGLRVERRGETLNLRGTLPPRETSYRQRAYQQRVPLGLPATKAGLKQIEQEAKVIAAKLIEKTFDWNLYLPQSRPQVLGSSSIEEKIAAFEAKLIHQASDDAKDLAAAKTTWEKAYAPYLRKLAQTLNQHRRLSFQEAVLATVQSTSAHSRSRQVCCTALGTFASFCGLDMAEALQPFWGNYSPNRTQRRQLPTDEEILAYSDRISNPNWRFVYGVMATYGLRNHEVFFCDYSQLATRQAEARITVLETTKTGLHDVWPFWPDWVERFKLRNILLPPLNLDLQQTTLQRIGQQVSTQFRRYGIPFSPYDLRHAWAVRTIHFGLPDTVAAKMMGHSVAIHNRTYHRWITLRDQQQAVQAALQRQTLNPR